MTPNYQDLFNESFARVTNSEEFFEHFYDNFLGSSEEITEKFKTTDMAVQRAMLSLSLIHMVAFSASGEPSATLQRVASIHSSAHKDIEAHLYDKWLQALIATARTHDTNWDEDVEQAWRRVLAPGIAYMKSCY